MLKSQRSISTSGCGLLKGDLVLPNLVLGKPESPSRWATRAVELGLRRAPVTTSVAKAVRPTNATDTADGRLEITDGRLYQDTKRKLSSTARSRRPRQGRRPAARPSCAQGKIENQPSRSLHRRLGLMLRDTEQPYPIDLNVDYGDRLTLKGTVQDPFGPAPRRSHALGPNLSEIYPACWVFPGRRRRPTASAAARREPGLWKFVNTKWRQRQRPHRRHPDRRDQEARVPDRQAGVAAPGLRRSGALWSARRRARPATSRRSRSRPSSFSKPPAICFPTCRSIPSACRGDEHGRHARRQRRSSRRTICRCRR